MATIQNVSLDISIVLGRCVMPVHQMLRLGRGAVIELNAGEDDLVEIQANDLTVAFGRVVVIGTRVAIEVVEMVQRLQVERALSVSPEPLAA